MKVFYSWLSDLPSRTNRNFILSALEKAAKSVARDSVGVEPVIDRDTQNVSGSPDIAQTIFDKIRTADAFVADVSIISGRRRKGRRLTPNPNVLVELGFAAAVLGWERIIVVNNSAFGREEDLPFDVRGRRAVSYRILETSTNEERADTMRVLSGVLASRIRDIQAQVHKKMTEANQRNIQVQWLFNGEEKNTIELPARPELTDFAHAFAPFDLEELTHLREHASAEAVKAEAYNVEVAKALANNDLRRQWVIWKRADRRERAVPCGVSVAVLYSEARDILVTLTFPEQVEIFDPYEPVQKVRPPALPVLPTLTSDRMQKIVLIPERAALPLRSIPMKPVSRLCHITSEHEISIHIEKLAQRRVKKLDGKESFLIVACGPPGEYKIHWRADAPTLTGPIEGELKLLIKPNLDPQSQPLPSRYIGPPIEPDISHETSAAIELQEKKTSLSPPRETQWVTKATRQKKIKDHLEKWLISKHQSVAPSTLPVTENSLKIDCLAINADGSRIGIILKFLTLPETSRSTLLHNLQELDLLATQEKRSGSFEEILLIMIVPDHSSAGRIHRFIGEDLDSGTIELQNTRLLIADLVFDELQLQSFV